MGLESRRDWNGNILPPSILAKLHAGNAQQVANGTGGNATNTLILIHIPAGGKKAVGFSIPRDDWVNFAGTVGPQQQGKIDQAYGVSMYYQEAKLRAQNPGLSQDQLAFLGNEAGRAAAVATVEKLTGVHIDHFAEVNLDGFYELAKVLSPRSTSTASTSWRRCSAAWRSACGTPCTTSSLERTSTPATSTWTPHRPWRSSASATACPTATWTGHTASRPSLTRCCTSCAPRA
jgi:hypothetical protein